MRLTQNICSKFILGFSVIVGVFNSFVFVTGYPQWVWNPDANTAPTSQTGNSGGGSASGQKVVFNEGVISDKEKVPVKIVDPEARFFPTIISAISTSLSGNRPNSGGSSSSSSSSSPGQGSSSTYPQNTGGGSDSTSSNSNKDGSIASCSDGSCTIKCGHNKIGACIGGALASQAIAAGIGAGTSIGTAVASNPSITGIFGNFLQNLFGGSGNGGANTLPGNIGTIGGGNSNKEPAVGSCSCVDSNACFLPKKAVGSCDNGAKVSCCATSRGTRTYFPDDDTRLNSIRSVTRSQLRRQLFRNIVRGSGDVIDDTLDLILHPFLTKEDQLKVATRVVLNDQ